MARPRPKGNTLGAVIYRRRQQLEMTQQQVADRVGCQANYIGYIEANMRRPSPALIAKLSKVLDLDSQELFFLSNPQARALVAREPEPAGSMWERFKANRKLHTRHSVSRAELAVLERVADLSPVRSQRDFLFILQAIRTAQMDE
jgi:transcriptional regulator with XRE-family HTH domain